MLLMSVCQILLWSCKVHGRPAHTYYTLKMTIFLSLYFIYLFLCVFGCAGVLEFLKNQSKLGS